MDGAGNVFITGYTNGSLGGPNAGFRDVFLAKYSASGTPLWTHQFGTTADDYSTGVAVDGAGNVYISGSTLGSLGGTNAGGEDAFLAKFDASGVPLWTRQFGTTADEGGKGMAVDRAGNAYITGWTLGSLFGPNAGGSDTFLAKYDASGTPLWMRQIGTPAFDIALGVAVDGAGSAYVSGFTAGSLFGPNAGINDVFLAKYDVSGTPLWTRQAGTPTSDISTGVAVDGAGSAYITGATYGSLGGPNAGSNDCFLAKYGPPFCTADFNQDGFVTGEDFDAFVEAFEAGC